MVQLVRSLPIDPPDAVDPIEVLYREHAEALYRIALRICGTAPDAEDVLQDVFLRLPQQLRTFRGDGPIGAWLRKITARTALARIRRKRGRKETSAPKVWPGQTDRQLRGVPIRAALERAIEKLPPTLRMVFLLREVEGYTHAEIAQLLGIKPGTSEVRLHRAKQQLRKELGER